MFKNIINYLFDSKNRNKLLFGLSIILFLFLLHQCNSIRNLKDEVKAEQRENIRITNNFEASQDTIRQFKISDSTTRAEILGYQLTVDELKDNYSELLGKYEIERNKKPKTIIRTEYIIKEVIREVPVYVASNEDGTYSIIFSDSTKFNELNYRNLSGNIPFIIDTSDVKPKVIPGNGNFDLELGMNLRLALFKDDITKKIMIKADTDYPGIKFTELEGADILYEDNSSTRDLRKRFSIGLSTGFGAMYNTQSNNIGVGPYIGIGLNYQPKILQW